MSWQWIILGTSLVLLSFVNKSSAIHCYYCNSANNTACLDFTLYDAEELSRIIPIVNCESAIPSPVHVNFFCRKIIQTTNKFKSPIINNSSEIIDGMEFFRENEKDKRFYHSDSQANVRVTRGCGWVSSHKPCYQANNRDHLETVCQCFEDMCNVGKHVDPSTVSILFLLLACVLYFYRD